MFSFEFIGFFLLFFNVQIQAQTCDNAIYYSAGTGNFTDANRWSTTSGGTGNYTYNPSDAYKHIFIVERGHTITVNSAVEVNNLIIGNTGANATVILNAGISFFCSGDSLRINSNGILQLNGNYLSAPGINNRFSMVGGTLRVNNELPSFLSAFENISITGGTVDYCFNGAQTINTLNYYNLTTSGSGIKTLNSSININGNLTISNATTLTIGADNANISLSGNWINQGTFNGNGKLTYTEFKNSAINQTITGYTSFQALRINKSSATSVILNDSIRVNTNLNFTGDGILSLGTRNLILSSNISQVNSSIGTFSSGRMIQLNGSATSGQMIKELISAAGFVFEFPIGTGTYYTPAVIGPLNATVSGTGRISLNSVPYTSTINNIIKRYITVTTNGISNITQAPVKFYYDQSEEAGNPKSVVRISGITYPITDADADLNTNYFGAGLTNTGLSGEWRYINASALSVTYYSYQDGNWTNSATWTTDPTGTTQIGMPAAGPTSIDNVVILNGRIITVSNNNDTVRSLTINQGGSIDLQATTGHFFGNIYGAGTLKLSSINLPAGTYTNFVSPAGGTIEYYNFTGQLRDNFLTYNNLVLSGTGTKTIGRNTALTYTVNGNLSVIGGQLTIGSTANTRINIGGNLDVSSGCNVRIPSANYTHQIFLSGNLTNNGSVRFTNQTTYDYFNNPNTGMLNVTFNSADHNQTVICNGQTDFYRFIVDKGTDQTFSVTVTASNTANFRIFGTNDDADSGAGDNNTPTRTIEKALAIQNGTLILGTNIAIPTLTNGNNYRINQSAALVIDGASVTASSSGGSCGSQAIVIYGREQINSGYLDNACSAGIILRSTGSFIMNGGTTDASQLRPSVTSDLHRGAVIINGGTLNLKPLNTIGETKIECARFSMPYSSMVFQMSGGIVNIYYPITNGTLGGGLEIGVSSDNYTVTGGTFNFYIEGNDNFAFTSTVPFYNLNIYKRGTGTGIAQVRSVDYNITGTQYNLPIQPLVVLNNFTLNNSIQTPALNTGNQDVTVMGNFTVMGNSGYTPGTNTTYIKGNNVSQIISSGNILNFNNLTINNTNSSGNVSLSGTGSVSVLGNLSILTGTFSDGGKTLLVNGNLINSATHTGSGRIRMNNAIATVSTIGGNGTGVWGNLELDDTNGALLISKQTINGILTLTNGIFDIAANRLAFTVTGNISVNTPTATKMIRTSGLSTDDGISKVYSSGTPNFTFPIGSGTNFTPVTISETAATYGTIVVTPVNKQHPLISIPPATVNDALRYYWNVSSQGFSGVTASSCQFNYTAALIPGGDGLDNSYLSAIYNSSSGSWNTLNSVVPASNRFTYNSVSNIDGDYTAGLAAAFGTITIFESRTSGNWEDNNTWRKIQGAITEDPATSIPTSVNPVIIRNGHTVTVTGTLGAVYSGSLEIQKNATLDLGTTISTFNHNFGTVIVDPINGCGTLRISSSGITGRFPAGDFINFLGNNGGSVIYYRNGSDFEIPSTSIAPSNITLSTYNNLQVIPSGGTITLPAQNLRIFSNLTTNATSANSLVLFNTAVNGNIQVDSSIYVSGYSTLQYSNNVARNISVNRNITIGPNASFIVSPNGTAVANTLLIRGNIVNNGTFRMFNNTRYSNVTFTGSSNATFSGTGTNSVFNRLILDKGTDTSYVLTVNATAFNLQATSSGTSKALELINGTFHLVSNQTITLSSGLNNGSNFEIPATTQLWIENGSAIVNSTGTNAGLFLAGKLKITGNGVVNISSSGTNDNYIEYSGVGTPSFDISGNGQLIVGSQIRRLTTSTNGSLKYSQSGGSVLVGSQTAPTGSRGVFEILNPGSNFTMSGGTLTIVREQTSATIAALYLDPSTYNVSGGNIQLGITGVTTSNLQVNSSIPLWNLSVGTSAGTSIRTSLSVNELKLKRNLFINSGAVFTTNNLNVSIGGDLVLNGTYTYGTNTTIFNGNINQNITGATSFNNLTINNTSSGGLVTINSDISVNGLLLLTSGVLFDNGHIITARGNIDNSAEHRSTGSGRIIMNNTSIQFLMGSGNGIFGSLELNNRNGVYLTTNQTINNTLTFTRGILNVDNHRLTLGNLFAVSGVTNDTLMIKTSGSQGDNGIQLNIVSGSFDYLLPIGVSGKYTPARFISTANTNSGWINVKPINSQHPLTSDVLNKEINYYWQVASNGLTGTIVTQEYKYVDFDVIGRGNETEYIGARYYNSSWTVNGVVQSSLNRILFSNVNFIDGDYLAGESSEFNLTFTTYQTAQSGNWEIGSTWVGGVVPVSNANVIINSNHIVTITSSSKKTYSMYIRNNGEVIVGSTTNHNFGITHGTGTLTIGSNIFPGGDFTGFVAADSGTIKYTHTGNISNALTSYNNLIIAGSGVLTLPFITPITIRGNLTIANGTLSAAGQRLQLYKNLTVNGSFVPGTSTVEFRGTAIQSITNSTLLNFWNLVINNSSGIVFSGSFQINNSASFINGVINLTGTNEAIFGVSSSHSFASDNSYINGIVHKVSSGTGFTFPVGLGQYRPLTLGAFSGDYAIQYYNTSYNPETVVSPVTRASDFEWWNVNRISGTSTPDLTINWTNSNQIPIISNINNLRIVNWNGTAWQETAGTPLYSGTINSGSITINGFAYNGRVTLATMDMPEIRCPGTSGVIYQADNDPLADSYIWTTDNPSLVSLTPDAGNPLRTTATFSSVNEGSGNMILTVKKGSVILSVKYFGFQVYPAQPVIILSGNSDFCEGSNVILSVPSGFNAYEWNSGQTTSSITVGNSGNYSVRVQHTNGCWSSFSNLQTVTAWPTPVINTINSVNNLELRY